MQNWNIAVTEFSKTPLLDTIRTPDDLRRLKVEQIRQVADELRMETIDAVSVTGGHFGDIPILHVGDGRSTVRRLRVVGAAKPGCPMVSLSQGGLDFEA